MKQSVRDGFVAFSTRFEGVVRWMYLDVKGLVTVAIGNLIDPEAAALALPFVIKGTDVPASRDSIASEWAMVKAHPTAAHAGYRVLEVVTSLRLTDDGVARVVLGRLDLNEQLLRAQFPGYASWPADAQLATHSMAWACGAYFAHGFARLGAALQAADFATAATQCKMNETGNAGLVPRNVANKQLYEFAARVGVEGLDPEALLYGSSMLTADQLEPQAATVHPAETL